MVNPIGTEERRVVNRKLVLHTPTLGSEPDAYHANVHCATVSTLKHRWELPGNYPVFTVVMAIYHYVERIWRILVTPIF